MATTPRLMLVLLCGLPLFAAPDNDSFAERLPIETEVSIAANTANATREANEPVHDGKTWLHTLWYEWTAPESGGYYFETVSIYPPGLSIYQGTSLSALVEVPSRRRYATDNSRLILPFRATEGQRYAIVLHDDRQRTNEFIIRHSIPHDDFEKSLEVILDAELHLDAPGATIEPGEEALHEYGFSVWHRFVAPTDGGYVAHAEGGYPLVFRGDSLSNLQPAEIVPLERYVYGFPFRAAAGETLYIVVGNTGGYRLRVNAAAPNDDFANRTPIASNYLVSDNGWATVEPGEPNQSTNFFGGSLWWKWNPGNSVPHRIVGRAAHYAGALSVYRGDPLTNLTLLARAEDFGYAGIGLDFTPEPGVEYSICLNHIPIGDNPVILEIHTPPQHDFFSESIPLLPGVSLTNIVGIATLEEGENWSTNKGTVWYSWTAPTTGSFGFLAGSPAYGADLHVFRGSTLQDLQPVASTVASLLETWQTFGISFRAEAGTTYFIAVALPFSIFPQTLYPTIVEGPRDDDLGSATELSGMYVEWLGTTVGATTEPDELSENDDNTASVWAKWTAPASAIFRIFVVSRFSGNVGVFDPATRDALGTGFRWVEFAAEKGHSYWIRVTSSPFAMAPFTLHLGPLATNTLPSLATEIVGTNILLQANFWTTSFVSSYGINGLWYQWTSPAHGMLNYSFSTNDTSAKIAFFHMNRPTIDSNAVVHTADSQWRPLSGSFAVAKDVTYLMVVQSLSKTNLLLSLQLDQVQDLGEWSDLLIGGSIVPIVQNAKFYSPPDALQIGPLQAGDRGWIEKTVLGRGTLRYRIAQGVNAPFMADPSFNWIEQTANLQNDTNVLRWTFYNPVGATGTLTAWFDDFEFVPAQPRVPAIAAGLSMSGFRLSFWLEAQRSTTIESSTNFVDWSSWTNVVSASSGFRTFFFPVSENDAGRFFRVRVSIIPSDP